jgi:3-hydroxyacyl-[acyl-carrier-protein] dehydratase
MNSQVLILIHLPQFSNQLLHHLVLTAKSFSFFAKTDVKFNLVDKIEHLSDQKIVTVKYVSLAEEYLADHFPTFPVLPGVMMLEAATQSAAWLLHHRSNFRCSMAVLKEARNVKYGMFVAPGNFLRIEAELLKEEQDGASFKATGFVASGATNAAQAVQMRLDLSYFNLADKNPELAEIDGRLAQHNRQRWEVLKGSVQGAKC